MNYKKFDIKLVSQRAYNLTIYGLNQVLSWIESVSITMGGVVNMSMAFLLVQSLPIINSISAQIKQLISTSANIIADIELYVSEIHSNMKVSTDTSHYVSVTFILPFTRTLARGISNIDSFIDFTSTVTIATLIKLEIYDPQTLGDLDTQTLGDLDSIIIT